mgnify:CR=1 FL=1
MISLVIPCFNEEENLIKLLDKLKFLLIKYSNENIEIIIVDNGSTDNSNKIIKNHELFLKKNITLIKIKENIGYGEGIHTGIKNSKGDIISWFHADLQFDPFDVMKIYKKYKEQLINEKIIVKGRRIERSIFDILFTYGMTIFTFLLFKQYINDINAQPKIFKRKFLELIVNPPKDFSYDIYFLLIACKNEVKIIEAPVKWHKRYAGIAKGGDSIKLKLKLTLKTLKYMMKVKKFF